MRRIWAAAKASQARGLDHDKVSAEPSGELARYLIESMSDAF
jgi:hypothetical protein